MVILSLKNLCQLGARIVALRDQLGLRQQRRPAAIIDRVERFELFKIFDIISKQPAGTGKMRKRNFHLFFASSLVDMN